MKSILSAALLLATLPLWVGCGEEEAPPAAPQEVILKVRTLDMAQKPVEMVRFYINGKRFGITDQDGTFEGRHAAKDGDTLSFNVEPPPGYSVPADIDQSQWQYTVKYPEDGRPLQLDFTANLQRPERDYLFMVRSEAPSTSVSVNGEMVGKTGPSGDVLLRVSGTPGMDFVAKAGKLSLKGTFAEDDEVYLLSAQRKGPIAEPDEADEPVAEAPPAAAPAAVEPPPAVVEPPIVVAQADPPPAVEPPPTRPAARPVEEDPFAGVAAAPTPPPARPSTPTPSTRPAAPAPPAPSTRPAPAERYEPPPPPPPPPSRNDALDDLLDIDEPPPVAQQQAAVAAAVPTPPPAQQQRNDVLDELGLLDDDEPPAAPPAVAPTPPAPTAAIPTPPGGSKSSSSKRRGKSTIGADGLDEDDTVVTKSDGRSRVAVTGSAGPSATTMGREEITARLNSIKQSLEQTTVLQKADVDFLASVERTHPGYYEANRLLADYYFRVPDYRRQAQALEAATSGGRYKHDPQVLLSLAKAHAQVKNYRKALSTMNRVEARMRRMPAAGKADVYRVHAELLEFEFLRQHHEDPRRANVSLVDKAITKWESLKTFSQGGNARDLALADKKIRELKELKNRVEL